ncbi:MAG TPA: chemotaxis protein CheW [Gemmatimonadales bacterium]|nr:chemotaxis protein CheW [Gemmatimonadales bacterium]
MSRGYLVVQVEGRPYGLPLGRVLEVSELPEVLDAPRALPAVRGLVALRGRLVPLVHLGALLGERAAPAVRGRTAVLVRLGDRQVAFEVDDAEEVVREQPLPLPRGQSLPWAAGVARPRGTGGGGGGGGGLIPILDFDALEERIR